MNTQKNRMKSFIGGIILGVLIGSYITNILMAHYIINSLDTCKTLNCIRYERVNTSK